MVEQLLCEDAKEIVSAVLNSARSGNMAAAKMVFDRLLPAGRGRMVRVDLPEVRSPADAEAAFKVALLAVGRGEITPEEGATIAGLIDVKFRPSEAARLSASFGFQLP